MYNVFELTAVGTLVVGTATVDTFVACAVRIGVTVLDCVMGAFPSRVLSSFLSTAFSDTFTVVGCKIAVGVPCLHTLPNWASSSLAARLSPSVTGVDGALAGGEDGTCPHVNGADAADAFVVGICAKGELVWLIVVDADASTAFASANAFVFAAWDKVGGDAPCFDAFTNWDSTSSLPASRAIVSSALPLTKLSPITTVVRDIIHLTFLKHNQIRFNFCMTMH